MYYGSNCMYFCFHFLTPRWSVNFIEPSSMPSAKSCSSLQPLKSWHNFRLVAADLHIILKILTVSRLTSKEVSLSLNQRKKCCFQCSIAKTFQCKVKKITGAWNQTIVYIHSFVRYTHAPGVFFFVLFKRPKPTELY